MSFVTRWWAEMHATTDATWHVANVMWAYRSRRDDPHTYVSDEEKRERRRSTPGPRTLLPGELHEQRLREQAEEQKRAQDAAFAAKTGAAATAAAATATAAAAPARAAPNKLDLTLMTAYGSQLPNALEATAQGETAYQAAKALNRLYIGGLSHPKNIDLRPYPVTELRSDHAYFVDGLWPVAWRALAHGVLTSAIGYMGVRVWANANAAYATPVTAAHTRNVPTAAIRFRQRGAAVVFGVLGALTGLNLGLRGLVNDFIGVVHTPPKLLQQQQQHRNGSPVSAVGNRAVATARTLPVVRTTVLAAQTRALVRARDPQHRRVAEYDQLMTLQNANALTTAAVGGAVAATAAARASAAAAAAPVSPSASAASLPPADVAALQALVAKKSA